MLTRVVVLTICLLLASCGCASADQANRTPLATGNGFGFAVFSFASGCIKGLYAHPYMFERPDPAKPLGEGIETTNFLESATWKTTDKEDEKSDKSLRTDPPDASYLQQSQIIQVKGQSGSQFFFMPFGLEENALIYLFQPDSKSTASEHILHVKWKNPVQSLRTENVAGHLAHLITFVDVKEHILLVPLSAERAQVNGSATAFKGPNGWALICLDGASSVPDSIGKLDHWLGRTPCQGLVQRELGEVEKWRVPAKVHFTSELEGKLWRQSEIVLRMGQIREPGIDNPMVEKAALDNYFVPEMYVSQVNYRFKGAVGEPTGAIPMVGYGAGVYINYILERERLLHPASR